MAESKIEWTDRSDWNPIRGCTRVSPGCGGPGPHGGCYAEALAARFSKPGMWGHGFAEMQGGKPRWTGKVELQEDRLTLPLRWRNPAKIFASSTSDIFHEALSDEEIDKIFAIMALAARHTFQVLTKRPKRMRDAVARIGKSIDVLDRQARSMGYTLKFEGLGLVPWPLPNVWLGVSCERQQEADERVPILLQTAAAIRFISAEPLLGPIDFGRIVRDALFTGKIFSDGKTCPIGWIIIGGESGPKHRPMKEQWARDIIADCDTAGVAAFMKQMAGKAPIPPHLMVRQFPNPLHIPQHY
jgi:protein gp37